MDGGGFGKERWDRRRRMSKKDITEFTITLASAMRRPNVTTVYIRDKLNNTPVVWKETYGYWTVLVNQNFMGSNQPPS